MLFDASAILNLFRNDESAALLKGMTIDLAFYEVGNSIRRKVCVEKVLTMEEGISALDSLTQVMTAMGLTQRANHRTVLETASEGDLTLYDASYLCAAEGAKETLVTDDKRLFDAAKKRMKVLRSSDVPRRDLGSLRGALEFESAAEKAAFLRDSTSRREERRS